MAGVGWRVAPFTLTVPPGAPPTSPRIVIGSDVPAALQAYYATGPWDGNPETVVEAILFYGANGVPYEWDALVLNPAGWGDGPIRTFGRFDPFSLQQFQETGRFIGSSMEFIPGTFLGMSGEIIVRPLLGGVIGVNGKVLTGQGASLSQGAGNGNRNNVAFANLPGNPAVSITKLYPAASTDLRCIFAISGYATVVGTIMSIAVNAGSGAAKGGQLFFNAINTHTSIPGQTRLTGLAAGTYTVNLQWASTGNVQQDPNDWNTLDVVEVAVQ